VERLSVRTQTAVPVPGSLAGTARRPRLAFRTVNRRDAPDYLPGMQRHHLLPRQLLSRRSLAPLFDAIGAGRLTFDDFRTNGLLLPSHDEAALRTGLPLHRGPHRAYNAMVLERIGRIEQEWSRLRFARPDRALDQALMRCALLQRALRRRLLIADRARLRLNRRDPLGTTADFSELDALADTLWAVTGP
jgi:hypothetical protein